MNEQYIFQTLSNNNTDLTAKKKLRPANWRLVSNMQKSEWQRDMILFDTGHWSFLHKLQSLYSALGSLIGMYASSSH